VASLLGEPLARTQLKKFLDIHNGSLIYFETIKHYNVTGL
jgi:hypothetical protein